MTTPTLLGLHHLTAIVSDPRRNIDFYSGVLGLRLVKITVNFDDPGTYHLYYGDGLGRPGTILTFFPWLDARRGRQGTGQVGTIALAIPSAALAYWIGRLITHGVRYDGPTRRFDEQVLSFRDPDGLLLELVAHGGADDRPGWADGPVPAEHAIRGLHSAALWLDGYELTARLLTETLGFRLVREEENRFRYALGDGRAGALLDIRCIPGFWQGAVAVGTVHHIAWRAADDEQQRAWRERLAALDLNVTPILDRTYFRSIYFREPGDVLFEIATDPPGFTVDEPPEALGTALKLPAWLEPQRDTIIQQLPPLPGR